MICRPWSQILNSQQRPQLVGTRHQIFFFTTNLNWGKYCFFPLINPRTGSSLRKHLLIMKTSTGLSTISWSNENRTYFLIGPLSIEGPASLENAFFVPKKFWDLWFPTGQNSVIVASSTFKFKFVNLYVLKCIHNYYQNVTDSLKTVDSGADRFRPRLTCPH